MNKFILKQSKLIKLLIIVVLQIILLIIIRSNPKFVELFYSNSIYPLIGTLMRYTFGWIPFSVGDVIYTLLIFYVLRWVILNRKRIYNDFFNWLVDISYALTFAYLSFLVFWGYNYYRLPIAEQLELKTQYSTESLIKITEKLINETNNLQFQITKDSAQKVILPYTHKQIHDEVVEAYKLLSKKHSIFKYPPPSVKASIYSLPLTYMGFSGYLNPFTNEAQVNYKIPIFSYPTTAAHEVAHQLGYAAENEANFIGALATTAHTNVYYKYTGYAFALRYCLNDLFTQNQSLYFKLLEKINKGVLENYKDTQKFWQAYQNPLEPIFEKTYDTFLKANKQPQGIKSYNYVVGLLVNYYTKHEM